MRSEVNGDECDCMCHRVPALHFQPCCETCPYCKRERMTYGHMMRCPSKPRRDPKCSGCGFIHEVCICP